jgi:DNA repair protein RecO (recombination protein O)
MASRAGRSAPSSALSAYVLHHYDWSESSLILDLFTREQGRLVVAARGAKKPHSNLRAVLLPLQRVAVTLGRSDGDAEVQNLRSAEYGGGAPMPSGAALFAGFYCNELLIKLLARHDPHARLFDAYADTLPHLAGDDEAVQAALRAFELVLLREIGLLPDLGLQTLTQKPLDPAARYALDAESGVVTARDGALSAPTLLALGDALAAGDPAALRTTCASALPALKPNLRALLAYHLGSPLLRSREAVRQNLKLIE